VFAVKKRPLRITAALLLVVALLTLSGLTATASSLIGAAAPHSCCDSDRDAPAAPLPCSSPDCTCFSCISMLVSPPFAPQRDGLVELLPLVTPKRHSSSAYVRSIDYPPEQA
jgi:hypothetical protein